MERNLPDFPLLFKQLGQFLYHIKELKERRLEADKLKAAFEALFESHSASEYDTAISAYNTLIDTIYTPSARGCPSGSPIVKG